LPNGFGGNLTGIAALFEFGPRRDARSVAPGEGSLRVLIVALERANDRYAKKAAAAPKNAVQPPNSRGHITDDCS
jgi:hypothetical protein